MKKYKTVKCKIQQNTVHIAITIIIIIIRQFFKIIVHRR